jgi:transcriptional regulator with XRE-family HTH domain
MSQRELAEEAGVGQVTITHIENGRRDHPYSSTQRVLAMALDYEVSDIFPPPGKPSTSPELRKLLANDLKKRKGSKR